LSEWGITESTKLNLKREDGGKIRVASMLWEDTRVILPDEVLVIRNVDGWLHIARKRAAIRPKVAAEYHDPLLRGDDISSLKRAQ
jgi:hypothetical protein